VGLVEAVNVIGRQHPLTGVFGVDPRHYDSVFRPEECAGEAGRFGFLKVIDLLTEHAADLFKLRFHRLPVFAKPQREQDRRQVAKIGIDGSRDAGVLNLDGDWFARFQTCPVDLAERCSGKRILIEVPENILGSFAELVAHNLADERVVHRRRIEVKAAQNIRHLFGDEKRQVSNGLTEFGHSAPHIPKPMKQRERHSQVCFHLPAFRAFSVGEPLAEPPRQVSQSDLC